jgi:PAS domain S-box-containing protein
VDLLPRLLAMLEESPDFVGNPDLKQRPFFINRAGRRLLGYGIEDEIPLTTIAELHPSWAYEKVRDEGIPAALREGIWIGETALLTRDGHEIPVLQVVQVHRADDGTVEFISTHMRDLTDRVKVEAVLRESEKLTATGRMAARVAHEINNPLAGIKNAFYLVKGAISKESPHYHFVGLIDREIDRLARIVQRMVVLYCPDQASAREFSLSARVQDVLRLLDSHIRNRSLKVQVIASEEPVMVELPESTVAEILFNITSNAIEASPPSGTVTIQLECLKNEVKIQVRDEGPGIPPELWGRIFEPFFTTKAPENGSGFGLGLTVSRSLAQSLGGRLEFDSQEGKGTSFRVFLPWKVY